MKHVIKTDINSEDTTHLYTKGCARSFHWHWIQNEMQKFKYFQLQQNKCTSLNYQKPNQCLYKLYIINFALYLRSHKVLSVHWSSDLNPLKATGVVYNVASLYLLYLTVWTYTGSIHHLINCYNRPITYENDHLIL